MGQENLNKGLMGYTSEDVDEDITNILAKQNQEKVTQDITELFN